MKTQKEKDMARATITGMITSVRMQKDGSLAYVDLRTRDGGSIWTVIKVTDQNRDMLNKYSSKFGSARSVWNLAESQTDGMERRNMEQMAKELMPPETYMTVTGSMRLKASKDPMTDGTEYIILADRAETFEKMPETKNAVSLRGDIWKTRSSIGRTGELTVGLNISGEREDMPILVKISQTDCPEAYTSLMKGDENGRLEVKGEMKCFPYTDGQGVKMNVMRIHAGKAQVLETTEERKTSAARTRKI